MSPDKSRQLCKDFPELCCDHGGDPRRTCMAGGFAVGDGWFPLLRRLLETADARRQLASSAGQEGAADWRLAQVKEKWGGLRVYWTGGDAVTFGATNRAEQESYATCEECGTQDSVTTAGGWLKTLCAACRANWQRRPVPTLVGRPAPTPDGIPV